MSGLQPPPLPPLPPRPLRPSSGSFYSSEQPAAVTGIVLLSIHTTPATAAFHHPQPPPQPALGWKSGNELVGVRRAVVLAVVALTVLLLLLVVILAPLGAAGKLGHHSGNNSPAPAPANHSSSSSSSSSTGAASISSSSFLTSSSSSSIPAPPPPTITSIELSLLNRTAKFYTAIANLTANQTMYLLAAHTTALTGSSGINDATLGGINQYSVDSVHRQGAAQALQLALYAGQTQLLNESIALVKLDVAIRIMQFRLWTNTAAAIADNGADGDVKQRQERGDICWEAWLLHQAAAASDKAALVLLTEAIRLAVLRVYWADSCIRCCHRTGTTYRCGHHCSMSTLC